jgi:transcriptional regulator with XRE-family HTH domain
MSTIAAQSLAIRRESPDATLARNLVTARIAAGITQQELANTSGISRATIAQIETGYSDPRLSTVVELAKALGVPVILLLVGFAEVRAISQIPNRVKEEGSLVDRRAVAQMKEHLDTGMLKDRLRAALVGANAVKSFSRTPLASITAAIFSGFSPGPGTEVGAVLGELLANPQGLP